MTQTKPALLQASAAIFDVDGTLVDSVDLHAEAWRRAFAEFGFEIAFADIRSQIGKGGDQLLPVFLDEGQRARLGERIEGFRQDLFKREYLARVRGFADVPKLFEFLIGRGKRVALGSSAKAEDLEAYKRAAGVADIDLVQTTSDDAERSKPHPDIFVVALERLQLPGAEVVAIGDTPYDIEAARKAGMRGVGMLCGGFPQESLVEAGAVEVYRDPRHLLSVLQAR